MWSEGRGGAGMGEMDHDTHPHLFFFFFIKLRQRPQLALANLHVRSLAVPWGTQGAVKVHVPCCCLFFGESVPAFG